MRRRLPLPLLAVAAGLCLTAATPPWGFWPLAFVGIVLLDVVLGRAQDRPWTRRAGLAWLAWAGLLFPTLFWMRDMTLPGYFIACVVYAGFLALGVIAAPKGAGRHLAVAGGVMLAEWVRWRWPFGGVPLSNLAIGQVAGPLAPVLRLGGALLVVGVTLAVGMAFAAVLARRFAIAATLSAVTLVALLVAAGAPAGDPTGERLDVALVQGGGPQGTRAATTEPGIVFDRHLEASGELDPDRQLDLVVWPEDVIDVEDLAGSAEEGLVQDLARDRGATTVVGVVEGDGPSHFRNFSVAYGPDGSEAGRYEKVERVPFGEWVPLRSFLERFAGDALPRRDAISGEGPAVIDTPVGPLGISISWEIFFGERARDAIGNGGQLLVNPTNGASYRGTLVQAQQVASSRMRAIETGRWVVQVAPTGFTAVIDDTGRVRQRTAVSERRVLYDTVQLRTGETLYVRHGDAPALAFAVVSLGAGWALDQRSRRDGVSRPRRTGRSPVRR